MTDYDHCPTCGKRIGDHDPEGTERPNGRRWCIIHYVEHVEALLKRAHHELSLPYWEQHDGDLVDHIAEVVETSCPGTVKYGISLLGGTPVAHCDHCRYVCVHWDDSDIDPDIEWSDNFKHEPVYL